MPKPIEATPNRAAKPPQSERFAAQAHPCTGDSPANRERREKLANACAAEWNAFHDKVGSFADEHLSL